MFVFLWKANLLFTVSQKAVIRKLKSLMAERSPEVKTKQTGKGQASGRKHRRMQQAHCWEQNMVLTLLSGSVSTLDNTDWGRPRHFLNVYFSFCLFYKF